MARPITLSLIVLIVAFCTLLALAILSATATRGASATAVALGCGLPLAILLLLAAVSGLASGGATASLPLPLGPPGLAGTLALDPIGLAFLLPLAVVAVAAFAVAEPEEAAALLAGLGAALLTLLAGDAFLLALGIGLAVLLAGSVARTVLVFGLVAAVAALAPHAGLLQGDAFTSLRAARGAGSGAGAFLVFPCGIAASLLLLWPAPQSDVSQSDVSQSDVSQPGAPQAARGPGVTLFRDAALPLLGLFLLVRLTFDLGAQPTPVPAALLLMLLGAAGGLLAGLDALVAPDLDRVVAGLGSASAMLAATAAGLALLARASDLAPVAACGMAATVLAAATIATARPLATLVCLSVREQAGSVRLASLGGLVMTMPRTAITFLLAAGALAALPPLAGFSALWLAIETLLAAAHGGEPGLPVLLAAVLAAIGLAVALSLVAALRAGAVAFLGRPRTPRGAAAAETHARLLRPMIGLAAALLLLSLLPGALLRLVAPALRVLAGVDAGAGPLALASPAGDAGFSPLLLVVLLAVLAAGPIVLRRRLRLAAPAEVATWDGGAAPAPDWLPFGEPLAQAGAASFVRGLPVPQPLLSARAPTVSIRAARHVLAWARRSRRRRFRRDGSLARLRHDGSRAGLVPALLAALALLLLAGGEAGWL